VNGSRSAVVRHQVVIVGGGFSGAAVAWHLARAGTREIAITVVEPRSRLGAGLAYGTDDPSHRINVPAAKMSLDPGDPGHFVRWVEAREAVRDDPDAIGPGGQLFPRRSVFGAYVGEQLDPLIAAGVVRHVRGRAVDVTPSGQRLAVALEGGETVVADLLVLAVGHTEPQAPAGYAEALRGHPRFIANPWAREAFAPLRPDDRVLVVGTGLTMADVLASLDAVGHRGPITAISRRGLASRGHGPAGSAFGDFSSTPAHTSLALLRRIRRTINEAAEADRPWQHVLDAVREQGFAIWSALPHEERRRLLRHLRPYWDSHRFRVAPQVAETIARRLRAGTLAIRAALTRDVVRDGDSIHIDLQDRWSGATTRRTMDAVILATGPAAGRLFERLPVLDSLQRLGVIRPDALRLGIDTDRKGRAVGASGDPDPRILVAGPLARATFGELMGLPEVAIHAVRVADAVRAALAETVSLANA
jgi:uncharacterized NAD(P)/FAD-binding protein YdhS